MKLQKKECTAFVYAFNDALMYAYVAYVTVCVIWISMLVYLEHVVAPHVPHKTHPFSCLFVGPRWFLFLAPLYVFCVLWHECGFQFLPGKIHPTKKGLVWTDQQKIQSRPGARADLKHFRQMGIEGKLPDFSNGLGFKRPNKLPQIGLKSGSLSLPNDVWEFPDSFVFISS